MNIETWQRAVALSARVHGHQMRKDGKTPYASHPFRVAMTIATVFGERDPEVLAAALLHDVIEDCDVDYDQLLDTFSRNVADYVAVMTKDMRLEEPIRESAYDKQLADGPWQGRLIKLADAFDNLHDATPEMRPRMIARARRAIALASDGGLREARASLESAVARIEATMATAS